MHNLAQDVAETPDRHTVLATAGFGALMVVLGIVVVANALALPRSNAVVGPAAVPLPVGALLAIVGAVLLVRSRGELRTATGDAPWQRGAGPRVLALVAALVVFAFVLPVLGYVVSSAALFADSGPATPSMAPCPNSSGRR